MQISDLFFNPYIIQGLAGERFFAIGQILDQKCVPIKSDISSEGRIVGFCGIRNHRLIRFDYIPIVSMGFGFSKIMCGTVYTIYHIYQAVINSQERNNHLTQASMGIKLISRGVILLVPILGNIILYWKDSRKAHDLAKKIIQGIEDNKSKYYNKIVVFCNDEEIMSESTTNSKESLQKLREIIKKEKYKACMDSNYNYFPDEKWELKNFEKA